MTEEQPEQQKPLWHYEKQDIGMGDSGYGLFRGKQQLGYISDRHWANVIVNGLNRDETNRDARNVLTSLKIWLFKKRQSAKQYNPQCNTYIIESYRRVSEKIEKLEEP